MEPIVCILGMVRVGKSALITALNINNNNNNNNGGQNIVVADNNNVQIEMYEHAPNSVEEGGNADKQDQQYSVPLHFARFSHAFLFVYAIDNLDSFNLAVWQFRDCKGKNEQHRELNRDYFCLLIGTKCDLPNRQVQTEIAAEFAHANGLYFLEVSSTTEHNIPELRNAIRQWAAQPQQP